MELFAGQKKDTGFFTQREMKAVRMTNEFTRGQQVMSHMHILFVVSIYVFPLTTLILWLLIGYHNLEPNFYRNGNWNLFFNWAVSLSTLIGGYLTSYLQQSKIN